MNNTSKLLVLIFFALFSFVHVEKSIADYHGPWPETHGNTCVYSEVNTNNTSAIVYFWRENGQIWSEIEPITEFYSNNRNDNFSALQNDANHGLYYSTSRYDNTFPTSDFYSKYAVTGKLFGPKVFRIRTLTRAQARNVLDRDSNFTILHWKKNDIINRMAFPAEGDPLPPCNVNPGGTGNSGGSSGCFIHSTK